MDTMFVYPIPKMEHVDLPETVNAITGSVVDSAITVQRELGPGLLENIYQDAMTYELGSRGHSVQREVLVPVMYRGVLVGKPLRIDILVDDAVVVECKAVQSFYGGDWAQTLSYLRLANKPVSLLINFHAFPLKDGIRRVVPPMS